jgi:citrate lyase subunit beta / citryl-CoA lyase
MNRDLPVWRSMLFVPAHVEKFVAKAHQRGADACVLDLEDGVPVSHKVEARLAVAAASQGIARQGTAVLVRVNTPWEATTLDLEAVFDPAVSAIVLPKVDDAAGVRIVAARLDQLEAERGVVHGHTLLIAQIEHVKALPQLDAIATSSPRLMGMSLGSEDFAVSAGMTPIPETLLGPNQQVAFACRRAGILPFGFPDSIANFSDLKAFRRVIMLADQLGFVGAFCVHPAQVAVLNEMFTPNAVEVEHARELLAAQRAVQRDGRGAFAYRGKMVDPPVVARAQELLRRHAVNTRSSESVPDDRSAPKFDE